MLLWEDDNAACPELFSFLSKAHAAVLARDTAQQSQPTTDRGSGARTTQANHARTSKFGRSEQVVDE